MTTGDVFLRLHGVEAVSADLLMLDVEVLTLAGDAPLPHCQVTLSIGDQFQRLVSDAAGRTRNQLVFRTEADRRISLSASTDAGSVVYEVLPVGYEERLAAALMGDKDATAERHAELEQEVSDLREANARLEEAKDASAAESAKTATALAQVQQVLEDERARAARQEKAYERKLSELQARLPDLAGVRIALPINDDDQTPQTLVETFNFWCEGNPEGFFPNELVETDQNDVVVDRTTGLMWDLLPSDEIELGDHNQHAAAFIRKKNAAAHRGFTDWRLPSLAEALSVAASLQGHPDAVDLPDNVATARAPNQTPAPDAGELRERSYSQYDMAHTRGLISIRKGSYSGRVVRGSYGRVVLCRSVTADEAYQVGLGDVQVTQT